VVLFTFFPPIDNLTRSGPDRSPRPKSARSNAPISILHTTSPRFQGPHKDLISSFIYFIFYFAFPFFLLNILLYSGRNLTLVLPLLPQSWSPHTHVPSTHPVCVALRCCGDTAQWSAPARPGSGSLLCPTAWIGSVVPLLSARLTTFGDFERSYIFLETLERPRKSLGFPFHKLISGPILLDPISGPEIYCDD
jgi:hypothetical protein